MKHRCGYFKVEENLDLYYQSWQPLNQTIAVMIIVHGLGGHSDHFKNLVQYFVPRHYAVYGFDLRGNGRSPGQRSYINSWSEYRSDLRVFLQLVREQEPDRPLFLLGHSLGGTIVLDYILRTGDRLQGIIAISPALGIGVSPFKMLLGKLLSRILPRFSLDTGLDLAASSRDLQVVAESEKDPLRHSLGTARLATELSQTIAWIEKHITDLQVPILIVHGGADRVTLPENSRLLFAKITFADKEIREYPESYHEIYHDLNYQELLVDLKDWLTRHLT